MCIWWDQLCFVYYVLLKPNETITGTVYWTQLMRLSQVLKEKRAHYYSRHDIVILLDDNAPPHVAAVLTRHCSYWFPLISIYAPWSVWAALHIRWKYKKLSRLEDGLNRRSILPSSYPYAPRKMGKSSCQGWAILRIKHKVPFFHNKSPIFDLKNCRNLFVHLIYKS